MNFSKIFIKYFENGKLKNKDDILIFANLVTRRLLTKFQFIFNSESAYYLACFDERSE